MRPVSNYEKRVVKSFSRARGSLRRLGREQLALGQLHWSAARYAPLQERALWDGLAAMYEQVPSNSAQVLAGNVASCT